MRWNELIASEAWEELWSPEGVAGAEMERISRRLLDPASAHEHDDVLRGRHAALADLKLKIEALAEEEFKPKDPASLNEEEFRQARPWLHATLDAVKSQKDKLTGRKP